MQLISSNRVHLLLLHRVGSVGSHTLGRQHNVQLQLLRRGATRALVLAHARWDALDGCEVDDEIVLNGEDGVGLEPWVVLGVDLGDDWLVVVMSDLEAKCQRFSKM